MHRQRPLYLSLALTTIALGLASRWYRAALPSFLGLFAGDVLWAAMVYLLIAAIFRRAAIRVLMVMSLLFAFGIEISQLYHAGWIDTLRDTRLGALVLGHSFLWSDLVCYLCGIGMAAAVDQMLHLPRRAPSSHR